MKFIDNHFEDYNKKLMKFNIHPKIEKMFNSFPKSIHKLGNLIFYGPSGVGKYSQSLSLIKRYSPSELKYEKKICVEYEKNQYFFKISDIHYEIDMSLLGCVSKLLWHEIYQQIMDIISTSSEKIGIILCKEFHNIHSELLDNLYSYIQENRPKIVNIKFIFLTKDIGFIPNNILNCCEIINISRPPTKAYLQIIQNKDKGKELFFTPLQLKYITNINYLEFNTMELNTPHKHLCDKILKEMRIIDKLNFLKFRDLIYELFIYNVDISECLWYIIYSLLDTNEIGKNKLSLVLLKTYNFLKYFNNNYRPIYHLENYLFYLVRVIHEL